MFIIPGQLISLVTFPGVVMHELAHQICCRICKIPVYEVKYYQFGNPSGYVVHEACSSPWKNLLISVGPFLFNTLLGMIITTPAYIQTFVFGSFSSMVTSPVGLLQLFLIWVGFSILMHAFPSSGDAKALVQSVLKNPEVNILAKIITAPIIGLIYVGALGSMFWLDAIYALALTAVVPQILVLFF